MILIKSRRLKDTLFGMLFVMRDGGKKPSQSAMRNLVILFLIDMGQVLRVLMSPFYGWNKATYDVAKHIDIVYDFTKICSFLVPRYTFFGIAFLLVLASIGDAFYCAKLFKAGDISKIGPVKALRFLVAIVVTTLFSSIMKWLLIPLECLASHEKSFSSYIHNDSDACAPWAFPDLVATIPTLVVVVIYVAFAFTATFFCVCTNPLAVAPNVQASGRVEALFLTSKVLATFLVFLSDHITPVATTLILFLLNLAVLYRHLAVLPFHHHATNLLRGGIYTCITWLTFASLLVAIVGTNDMIEDDVFQTMQWMLIGFLPVAFPLGVWLTHFRRSSLLLSLDRLRGEYEVYQMQGTGDTLSHSSATPLQGGKGLGETTNGSPLTGANGPTGNAKRVAAPRNAYDNFFDPSWERKRAFGSGQHAHTIARTLLMQRNEGDLPFLAYIVSRSLEEHADSEVLQIFRISLQRFVFRNTQEAAAEEKKLRGANKKLAMDYEYILYAAERKATQDYAASNMGSGNYNAINLMEFDSGMQNARSAHLSCIVEMRKFWGSMSSKRKKANLHTQIESSVSHLVEFNKAQEKADAEYHTLLEKYPQSVQLLQAYASYCDIVNNDLKHAEQLRKQAAMLEDGEESEEDKTALDGRQDKGDASSAASSVNENFRLRTLRAFSTWSDTIWGQEWKHVMQMNRRVRFCCLALCAVSITGFLVMQLWLFKSMAAKDVHLINMTGLLRAWAVSSCFLIRTQFLKSLAGDTEAAATVAGKVATLAGNLQAQHWSNYEIIRTKKVRDYYLEPSLELSVPSGLGWSQQTFTFWAFGTDWTRRMERASQTTVAELQASTDWSPQSLSEGKINIQFLNENAFRAAIPAFESIVKLYEVEMKNLWKLTQTLVVACTSGNVALLVAIGFFLLWGVTKTIQQMQHMQLACNLAIQLPVVTSKKLAQFYKKAEGEMRCHEDEEAERKKLIEEDTSPVSPRQNPFRRHSSFDMDRSSYGEDSRGGAKVKSLSTANLERFAKDFNHPVSSAQKGGVNPPKSKRSPSHRRRTSAPTLLDSPSALSGSMLRNSKGVLLPSSGFETTYAEEEMEERRRDGNAVDVEQAELVFNSKAGLADLQDDSRSRGGGEGRGIAPLVLPQAWFKVKAGREEEDEDEEEEREEEDEEEDAAGVWGSLSSQSRGSETEEEKAERKERREKRAAMTTRWEVMATGAKKREKERVHQIAASAPIQKVEEKEQNEQKEQEVEISSRAPMTVTDLNDKKDKNNRINAEHEGHSRMKSSIKGMRKGTGNDDEKSDEDEDKRAEEMLHTVSLRLNTAHRNHKKVGFFKALFSGSVRNMFSASQTGSKSNVFRGGANGQHSEEDGAPAHGGEQEEVEEKELLPLNEVSDIQREAISTCLRKEWPVWVRTSVHLAVALICMGLSILNTTYPTRKMQQLVTLAPTINQAGRRRFLTRSCVHLSRELVLDDGFSRMHKTDIASALNFYLSELKVANDAVRLGGALDITVGADYRNEQHNAIMYGKGCPWREDPSDCSTPERPGAAANGLYHLSLSFFDAVQSVLIRYGPDPSEYRDDFLTNPRLNLNDEKQFETVAVDKNRTALLSSDPELVFIMNSFAGDMFTGFALLVEVFDQELREIVSLATEDNQRIFIVYMLATFVGLYLILFRNAVRCASAETHKARAFVGRIPSYTLSQLEIDTVASIFSGERPDL